MVVNLAVTLPIPDIVAVYVDPAVTGTIGPSAPERITSPDRNGAPYSKLVAASHANASHGLPRQSAPLASRDLCSVCANGHRDLGEVGSIDSVHSLPPST